MLAVVVDCETTGLDPEQEKVCELAAVHVNLETRAIVSRRSTFVDPQRSIPPEITAIHHITNEHVRGAPTLEEALSWCVYSSPDLVVAHNAKFDESFLKIDAPWLCTYRLASHLFPDAPTASNQGLRYWFGLPDPLSDLPPHRALPDAEVTAHLLLRLVGEFEKSQGIHMSTGQLIDAMVEMSNSPILQRICRLPKHRGTPWAEVPADYLRWIVEKMKDADPDLLYTARYYLGMGSK